LKKSDYKGALEDLNTGIEKDADMPICYYARGHYGGANYEEAVGDFTRVLRLSPTPKGYESRGKAFEQLGKRDEALSDYQAALKLAPAQEALQRLTKRQDGADLFLVRILCARNPNCFSGLQAVKHPSHAILIFINMAHDHVT
jgi:tetratricopeptide (TPR) repeat protein